MPLPWEVIYEVVQDEVNRPDRMDEIKRRIQRAVLKYHRIERFRRDILESAMVFPASQAIQQIDISLLATFREVVYIRLNDPTQTNNLTTLLGTTEGNDFEQISIQRVMDGYGYDKNRVWYLAGTQINLRAEASFQNIQWGYLVLPVVEPIESMTSWIAQQHYELIAQEVVKRIFVSTGKLDEANGMERERMRSELILLSSDVISK